MFSPAGDHRGTGRIERLIRTIEERMGATEIANRNSRTGWTLNLRQILWGLRSTPNPESKRSPFEKYFGRKPNTSLRLLVHKPNAENLNLYPIDLDRRRILKPGHMLDLTDEDSSENLWQDADGSH